MWLLGTIAVTEAMKYASLAGTLHYNYMEPVMSICILYIWKKLKTWRKRMKKKNGRMSIFQACASYRYNFLLNCCFMLVCNISRIDPINLLLDRRKICPVNDSSIFLNWFLYTYRSAQHAKKSIFSFKRKKNTTQNNVITCVRAWEQISRYIQFFKL